MDPSKGRGHLRGPSGGGGGGSTHMGGGLHAFLEMGQLHSHVSSRTVLFSLLCDPYSVQWQYY